jgi:hypothetical protein
MWRERLRLGIAVVAVIVALVGAVATAVHWYGHGPVDATSLHHSVERESGAQAAIDDESDECSRRRQDLWRCEVIDSGGSGGVTYDVRIREGSCWTGRLRVSSGEPMPARISGCVLLRD